MPAVISSVSTTIEPTDNGPHSLTLNAAYQPTFWTANCAARFNSIIATDNNTIVAANAPAVIKSIIAAIHPAERSAHYASINATVFIADGTAFCATNYPT